MGSVEHKYHACECLRQNTVKLMFLFLCRYMRTHGIYTPYFRQKTRNICFTFFFSEAFAHMAFMLHVSDINPKHTFYVLVSDLLAHRIFILHLSNARRLLCGTTEGRKQTNTDWRTVTHTMRLRLRSVLILSVHHSRLTSRTYLRSEISTSRLAVVQSASCRSKPSTNSVRSINTSNYECALASPD